jgi:hypothetical protein
MLLHATRTCQAHINNIFVSMPCGAFCCSERQLEPACRHRRRHTKPVHAREACFTLHRDGAMP